MGILKENYLDERIALGLIPGITQINLIGVNGAITTTHETIWGESTAYAFIAAAMSSPTISSDNANDTAAGTGARTVLVEGVNASFAAISETATLNGQTGVALTGAYMSINKMTVVTAGSGAVNAGIIYIGTGSITAGKPAVVHNLISASNLLSTSFIYTAASGKTLLLKELVCASRSTTAGGHEIVVEAIQNFGPVIRVFNAGFLNTGELITINCFLKFDEKSQVQLKALASAGTGPFYAFGRGWLIDNDSNVLGL